MKCPICGKDVELQKKQVGVDEQGTPIFHQYAVCRDCKKQWDLDKQRARKVVPDPAVNSEKPEAPVVKTEKVQKEESAPEAVQKSAMVKKGSSGEEKHEGKADSTVSPRPVRRKPSSGQTVSQKPPQEKPAAKKEAAEAGTAGSLPIEKKALRKAMPEKPATEKKAPRKPVPNEASGDKQAAHKAGEGNRSSTAKAPRKPAPGGASPEKRTRRPDSEKPASEKAGAPRAKRPSGGPTSEKASAERPVSGKAPVKKRAAGANVKPGNEALSTDTHRKKAVHKTSDGSDEQRYGNIPPEKVRVKKEHAVKQGYEDMLSTDPNHKPVKKKKPVPAESVQPVKKERPAQVKQRPDTKASMEDEYDDEEMEYEDIPARFHILRIILGIISVLAAGFFAYGGFFEGLENIASGSTVSTGTTFIIFAICMLVSGLLLLIMQNRNTILAFILPMIFYLGAAVFMFLKRQDNKMFLYCAIAGAVLGVIFLVLGIISRNSGGYAGDENYDDPFEDDYE